MSPALMEISIDVIEMKDNPRDHFDKKGDAFKQLVESVKTHGIITPITVSPNGADGFLLIAGQRRILAAKEAGLTSIPAQVMDANGSALAKSVSENIHREAMTPMQEARAFKTASETMKIAEIAQAYSVSQDLVRERLRLLKLPQALQKGVDSREIPLGAANLLAGIAEGSEPLAKAIAEAITAKDSGITLNQLIQNTGNVIRQAVELSSDPAAIAFSTISTGLRPADTKAFSDEQVAELAELFERKPEYSYSQLLRDEDVSAADAYGCLLVIADGYGRESSYITDPDFLFDRLKESLTALAKKGDEDRAKREKDMKKAKGVDSAASDEDAKRQAAEVRAEQKRERIAAIHRNTELGEHLKTVAKEIPVDKDVMAVLGEMILDHFGLDLYNRGLRYVSPEIRHVEPPAKDGQVPKIERTAETGDEAKKAVRELWEKQKTPEQMAGFLLQLLVSAYFADQQEVPQSDRKGNAIPWLVGYNDGVPRITRETRGAKALHKLALKLSPKSVRAWVKTHEDAYAKVAVDETGAEG